MERETALSSIYLLLSIFEKIAIAHKTFFLTGCRTMSHLPYC